MASDVNGDHITTHNKETVVDITDIHVLRCIIVGNFSSIQY